MKDLVFVELRVARTHLKFKDYQWAHDGVPKLDHRRTIKEHHNMIADLHIRKINNMSKEHVLILTLRHRGP